MFRRKPDVVVKRKVRDPYYDIEGIKRFGYKVLIIDDSVEDIWHGSTVDGRKFLFGRRRAERWGQRALGRYLRKRAHQEYRKTGYTTK